MGMDEKHKLPFAQMMATKTTVSKNNEVSDK